MNIASNTTGFFLKAFGFIILITMGWTQVAEPALDSNGGCFSPDSCISQMERNVNSAIDDMAW